MDPDLVYARSAKGEEEIRTRKHQLRPLQRQSLILIDGHSPLKVLLSRWAALRGFEESIMQLERDGFIEPLPAAAPASAPAQPAGQPGEAEEVRRQLLDWLAAQLPARDAKFAAKLQAAPASPDGLQAAVDACCRLLRLTVDEKLAARFAEHAKALLKKA